MILALPIDAACDQARSVVWAKRSWIYRKLATKDLLLKENSSREFVNGESYPYLGRHYRLRISGTDGETLKLRDGSFVLDRSVCDSARDCFVAWYVQRAREWLPGRVEKAAERMQLEPARIGIRDLGFRWASCGPTGMLNFHWRTILLPPRIIDYIVAHELAHLAARHHDDEFWRILERALPDVHQRRIWLAENATSYSI